VNDWPDAFGSDNSPNEKGYSCSRDDVCLDGEKVSYLVDWKPDGGQRTEPEDEE